MQETHNDTTVVLHSIPDSFDRPFHDHYDMTSQTGYEALVQELGQENPFIEWLQAYTVLPAYNHLLITDVGLNFYGHVASEKDVRMLLSDIQHNLDILLQCEKNTSEWTTAYTSLNRDVASVKSINNLAIKSSWLADCVRYDIKQ